MPHSYSSPPPKNQWTSTFESSFSCVKSCSSSSPRKPTFKKYQISSIIFGQFNIQTVSKIKSAVVNSNNRLNGTFDTSHKELSSGFHLIDNFPNHFSFHTVNRQDKEIKSAHIRKLDRIFEDSCLDSKTVLVISDASIKNDAVTSILHVYFGGNTIAKTIHHTIKVTSTEAELFAIRCGINQAVQVTEATHIIVVMDTIHSARSIFDSLIHPYQLLFLRCSAFFNKSSSNTINFWDCPSKDKWAHHSIVDKETKQFICNPLLPCKSLWNFSKKIESDSIINEWQMTFQALDYKGNHFLNLLNEEYLPIKPMYVKGGLWLKLLGYSNSLCARATRAIINHALIGEYRLRFFP